MSHNEDFGALDNDAIVQYTIPYQFKQPQDILPTDDTPFIMMVCTNKSRLDATLSALLDYSHQNNYPETYEHNVDIINALASIYFVNGLDCGNMDLCDLIEQCLTGAANGDNQSLADVINQIIQNNSSSSIDVDSTTQYDIRYENGSAPISDVSLDDGQGGCDLDVMWGACFEVAERIAQMGLDILETYTASADKIQKIAAISGAIPFVGDISNALLSAAADIAQDIENAYVAYETPAIIEQVACDIFCMVQSECRFPTFDELLDYYATGGNTSLIEILSLSYSQLYGQIFNTVLGNPIVWYGVQTFALATLYLDGVVLGNKGTKTIEQWALVGAGSPSNAHETLCACSSPPDNLYEWDFTQNDGGWRLRSDTPNRGEYIAGNGWVTTVDVGAQRLIIVKDDMVGIELEEVQVQGTGYLGATFTMDAKQINLRDNETSSSGQVLVFNSSGGNQDVCSVGTNGLPESRNTLAATYYTTNTTNRFVIQKIRIKYTSGTPTGGAPGWSEDCNV